MVRSQLLTPGGLKRERTYMKRLDKEREMEEDGDKEIRTEILI